MIELKVTKNVVGNGFLKIFCSVKWLQYLLEGLKLSSVEVAPDRNSSIHIDIRFDLIDEYFEKKQMFFNKIFQSYPVVFCLCLSQSKLLLGLSSNAC